MNVLIFLGIPFLFVAMIIIAIIGAVYYDDCRATKNPIANFFFISYFKLKNYCKNNTLNMFIVELPSRKSHLQWDNTKELIKASYYMKKLQKKFNNISTKGMKELVKELNSNHFVKHLHLNLEEYKQFVDIFRKYGGEDYAYKSPAFSIESEDGKDLFNACQRFYNNDNEKKNYLNGLNKKDNAQQVILDKFDEIHKEEWNNVLNEFDKVCERNFNKADNDDNDFSAKTMHKLLNRQK